MSSYITSGNIVFDSQDNKLLMIEDLEITIYILIVEDHINISKELTQHICSLKRMYCMMVANLMNFHV